MLAVSLSGQNDEWGFLVGFMFISMWRCIMQRLREASQARTKLREQAQCAPIVNMNCLIHVKNVESEDPDITLRSVAVHESEARTAVMEMMVLAGQVAAKWASAKGVPVLYRCGGYHLLVTVTVREACT